MGRFSLNRSLQFLCISGASLLYYVPYSISSFYDAFQAAFNATNTQLGLLTSCYTSATILFYFLGGMVADKISSRKLLAFSYFSTGVLAVVFSMFINIHVAMVLMAMMGLTTTLTFWAAMQKATRIFIGVGNEGLGTGGVECVRNIMSSIVATIALIFFGMYADMVLGLRFVILFFAAFLVLLGVGSWFLLEKDDPKAPEDGSIAKYLISCLKNTNVWIASLIIGLFTVSYVAVKYVTPYATGVFGLSVATGALLGTCKEYFRPIGALISGVMSNRFGVSKMLTIFGLICALSCFFIGFVPQNASLVMLIFIGGATSFAIFGGVRGLYFATVGEGNVPLYQTGTAVGIMSTLGFLPDSFSPIVFGRILDSLPAETAYPLIFNIAGISAVLGAIVTFIFYKKNKATVDRIMEKKAAERLAKKQEKATA